MSVGDAGHEVPKPGCNARGGWPALQPSGWRYLNLKLFQPLDYRYMEHFMRMGSPTGTVRGGMSRKFVSTVPGESKLVLSEAFCETRDKSLQPVVDLLAVFCQCFFVIPITQIPGRHGADEEPSHRSGVDPGPPQ